MLSRLITQTAGRQSPNRRTTHTDAPKLHGEIFVCVDEAVLQARKFGTSWQSEIVRYIVHGVLHLLGFDDSSAGARRKMKREENRLVARTFPPIFTRATLPSS